jgi:hypothetical protein
VLAAALRLDGAQVAGYLDLVVYPSPPGNPSGTYFRLYMTPSGLNCVTSTGTSCLAVGTISMPTTTADQGSSPEAPAAGSTKWYTRNGRLCSLDPANTEACTGGLTVPITLAPVPASSQFNSGDRHTLITVSTPPWFWSNQGSCATCDAAQVNGDPDHWDPYWGLSSFGTWGDAGISFDFGAAHYVTGVKIWASGTSGNKMSGCKIQGSTDNATWVDITTPFDVAAPAAPYTVASGIAQNTTAYRYYRFFIHSTETIVTNEFEFEVDSAPYNSIVETVTGKAINTGSVDNSNAAHTLPIRVGPLAFLPGSCSLGEYYFASDVPAGWNQYTCTASNTWTPPSFGNALPLTLVAPNNSAFNLGNRQAAITVSTSAWFWANTDWCSWCDHVMVDGNRTSVPDNFGGGGYMLFDFGTAHAVSGATIFSGSCSGNLMANAKWSVSNDNSTWSDLALFTAACAASSSASGYADTTLAANTTAYRYYRLTTGTINGSTGPTEFEFTVDYNPAGYTVETATGRQINNGGAVDYSAAVHTLPVRVGPSASMPSACTQGELYFATDAATPGKNLNLCTETNTWTATP